MQAQIMQDVQRMQANAQAPVLPAMTFSSTDPDVSFHRIMQGALGHVDQFQQVAEQQQTAIDMGKSDDLAGAMIASQQAAKVSQVIFTLLDRLPKRRMSTRSRMACMTEPAPRNIPALKKPWVTRWKIANM